MIHVIRENEGIEDIAEKYGVDAYSIIDANRSTQFIPNRAIWVPMAYSPLFLKNQRRKHQNPLSFSIYAICQTKAEDASGIEHSPWPIKGVFIDAYEPFGASLGIKDDAFLISCSLFHGAEPSLVIRNLGWYMRSGNLHKLFSSLKYKAYASALLCIENLEDMFWHEKIRDCLYGYGLDVYIEAGESILAKIGDSNRVSGYFFKPHKNLVGFAPFAKALSSVAKTLPIDKVGCMMSMTAADVNKHTMAASFPEAIAIENIIAREGIKSLFFDEETMLCFMQYSKNGEIHNVVFEDLRSLQAKTNCLRELGIKSLMVDKPSSLLGPVSNIAQQ